MIYLDTSAIVKLIRPELESDKLVDWLNAQQNERVITSKLAEVELPRALRREEPARLAAVAGVLAHLDRLDIDDAVRATAGAYPFPHLRSLDAIHLATADQLVASGKTVSAFVTYDRRLAVTAGELGLAVAAPGRSVPV
ncbi:MULTISPECIES: type II toxin-antitoxin system VapC family toxin [Protofrankia]|uniref:Ribonuclease VapC n=1 Tax=Candidatus Protofrankia datiscae TaxID=2716812 RepID=F8B4X3_9ACTN|nr:MULTISPECIES: type II toxin-antitoxin system VapC family toxin [Protofrankia]AEH10098.1 PilT protein domain protein [Candidatus Protofrankia datiscae]